MPSQGKLDDGLVELRGRSFASQFVPGVQYRLGPLVGQGAMAVAFYALRTAPEGYCPVVIKLLKPSFLRHYGQAATLTIQKESVALGRLNERVPSTPFVVRLIDTGQLEVTDRFGPLALPWLAVEYVHGGPEGTTLTQRVRGTVEATGLAFDTQRAARAISCLCSGLSAVHEVGVIHRDLKPGNVLCCGTGEDEILKVADFGVARPQGLAGTFFRDFVGTVGYVAPEAFGSRGAECGPWTDIFGLAGVVYFLLTGQKYLRVQTPAEMLITMGSPERPSVIESPMLCPELRKREAACQAIDRALASSTALDPDGRPASVEAFAASVLPWLQSDASTRAPASRIAPLSVNRATGIQASSWSWILRHRASDSLVVRRVAFDSDGRCLAVTNEGLAFWHGTGWHRIKHTTVSADNLRLVHRVGPSRFLVGFDRASLASFSSEGMLDTVDLSETVNHLDAFDGQLGDLAVVVDRTKEGAPLLRAMSAWRWVRPIALERVAAVSSLARVGDAQWLIAGRDENDAGMVAVYRPLDFELKTLPSPPVRAFMACAGREGIETGAACGADGAILWWHESQVQLETVEGGHDVSAIALDPSGQGWAAGAGRIWRRDYEINGSTWRCVWENETWQVPFVALFAHMGLVTAITADGAILEGRQMGGDQDTEFMSESEK